MTHSRHKLNPAQSALLVMDFQPFKLRHLPDADGLLTRTADAIEFARKKAVQVAHVWSGYTDLDYATVPDSNRRLLPAIKQRILHVDVPASAIHEAVAPQEGDIVERKTRIGAFARTGLDEQLTNLGVTELILTGVFTSSTVLSTVRDAADKDYQLYVLEDCVADPDPAVHDFLIRTVLATQAKIVASGELDTLIH